MALQSARNLRQHSFVNVLFAWIILASTTILMVKHRAGVTIPILVWAFVQTWWGLQTSAPRHSAYW